MSTDRKKENEDLSNVQFSVACEANKINKSLQTNEYSSFLLNFDDYGCNLPEFLVFKMKRHNLSYTLL